MQSIINLAAIWRFRELLYMLTWRDIRIRYKQSVMGLLWAVLMPSLVVGAGALVRIGAAKYTGHAVSMDDIASVMVRAVAWSFFIAGIRFGTNSLVSNGSLVTKIAFPKEVFPIAATLSSLFDFAVASLAVFAALLFMGWVPHVHGLWAIPLILVLAMLTTGLSLLLAAANLFFRDVKYLVEVFLTYAIFFTPVLYDADMLGEWKTLVLINPVASILEGLAAVLVHDANPDPQWLLYSTVFSFVTLIFGYWLFKQLEPQFAESI
jgi:ABC-type polysaccharide/polyol phosphate export permease